MWNYLIRFPKYTSIFGILLLLFLNPKGLYPEIVWSDSYKKALDHARIKSTPIVLEFYTDWCGYCKILENKIFPEPEVVRLLENFTTLRINAERNPEIANLYRASEYPTVLFLDKNGAYLDRIVGLPNTSAFIKKLKDVYEKRNLEEQLLAAHKLEPDSVLLNYRLGIYYFKSSNFPRSESFFLKAINSPKSDSPEKRMESLFNLGIIQIQEKKFSEGISIWSKYLQDYPSGDESSARYYRGVCLFYLGKSTDAKEDFLRAKYLAAEPYRKAKIQEFLDEID